LALGHAVSYLIGMVLQGRVLSARIGGLDLRRVLRSGAKAVVAGAGMGVLVWLSSRLLEDNMTFAGFGQQAVGVIVPVLVGVVSYLAFAYLLRVEEMKQVGSLVGRRWGGR
jgi:putative peptidoglycan lipid II flippase